MARCIVAGSVAVDEVVRLAEPLRRDAHLHGTAAGRRLGGGGANTAIPLAQAGHQVALASAVGTDADGEWLLGQLSAAGLDTRHVQRRQGTSTRSLVLVEPGGERTIVNLHRCSAPELLRGLAGEPADVVYVRSSEPDLAPWLQARLATATVVSHLPPVAEGCRPAQVLLGSASDLAEEHLRSPWELGRRVAGEALRLVIVTRGAGGATAYSAESCFHVEAPAVESVDGTGAGDVFAAGLIHALASGAGDRRAVEVAVAWGSAAAACSGLPGRERIRQLV